MPATLPCPVQLSFINQHLICSLKEGPAQHPTPASSVSTSQSISPGSTGICNTRQLTLSMPTPLGFDELRDLQLPATLVVDYPMSPPPRPGLHLAPDSTSPL